MSSPPVDPFQSRHPVSKVQSWLPAILSAAAMQVTLHAQFEPPVNIPPTITLSESELTCFLNSARVVLDSMATITDPDSVDFGTGMLTVEITANASASDVLNIISAGQITITGVATIRSGPTTIGSYSYSDGMLVVNFNNSATPALAQAVLRNVSFQTTSGTGARSVQCIVWDGDGGISAAATKVINVFATNSTPTISDTASQTIDANTSTGTLALTVGDAETAASSLTVSGTSSNITLVPNSNIVVGGSGQNRTVTVTPANNQSGSALITVTVSDGALTTNDTFIVTVNGTTFSAWQQAKFTEAELLDANVSGPDAVYGSDGLSNLVKYALGLEPKANTTTGLPELNMVGTEWFFYYVRPSKVTDVNYAVEVSTGLTTWTTVGITHEFVSTNGSIATWRGRYSLNPVNAFFRLKATLIM